MFQVALGTSWHVAEVGDFNGDGLSDVLLRSDGGQVATWLAEPGGIQVNAWTGTLAAQWTVEGHVFTL